ncbi:MAG: hypothetical protein IRY91_13820 [Gemmatimonadaceae bacterium]|nr:hypothetical protein [Gemmatimonadaceae bacterium]
MPSTLEGALPLAVPTLAVPEGSTLALYWECYADPSPAHPLTVTLRLTPHRPSLGSRVLHAFGIGRSAAPISLRWTDVGADSTIGRSLRLALPRVPPGRYTLELAATRAGEHTRASREITVTEREP